MPSRRAAKQYFDDLLRSQFQISSRYHTSSLGLQIVLDIHRGCAPNYAAGRNRIEFGSRRSPLWPSHTLDGH